MLKKANDGNEIFKIKRRTAATAFCGKTLKFNLI
jgi:hypothetical protein